MHFLPLIAALVNALITKVRYQVSDYKYCLHIGVVYATCNYMGTIMHGKPMYPFMNWENWWTIVNSAVLIAISMLQFISVASFVNWTKDKTTQIK